MPAIEYPFQPTPDSPPPQSGILTLENEKDSGKETGLEDAELRKPRRTTSAIINISEMALDKPDRHDLHKQAIPSSSLTMWSVMMIVLFIAGIALRISAF